MTFLMAFILGALPLAAATAAAPTKDEVVAVVKKAVEYYKANGKEKALAEFNNRDGLFAKGEDYVDVHDINGVCVAHPISPAKVGLNRLDLSDSAGKFYVKELVEAAKTEALRMDRVRNEEPHDRKTARTRRPIGKRTTGSSSRPARTQTDRRIIVGSRRRPAHRLGHSHEIDRRLLIALADAAGAAAADSGHSRASRRSTIASRPESMRPRRACSTRRCAA